MTPTDPLDTSLDDELDDFDDDLDGALDGVDDRAADDPVLLAPPPRRRRRGEDEVIEPLGVVAIVGRPNVGKSTLTNRVQGEERQVVFDQPGTTRDSIEIPFERDGREFVLIDTAGVRRKGRVDEVVE